MQWADATPAAGIAVAIPELKLETKTDARGQFAFDGIRPGIRITLNAFLDQRLLGREFTLVTLSVEEVDFHLAGLPSNPTPAAQVPAGIQQDGRRAPAPDAATSTGGDTAGSSEVQVANALPILDASTKGSTVSLKPEQVTALPSLGLRDLFRALQWLPGVSNNETSSGLYVRGGTPGQNVVDYDGFKVYSADHLFGYVSAFNMDAIDSIDLSKGAYNARFGDGLSSLTEVHGKSQPARVQGSVGASLLDAHGAVQIPVGEKASFLFAYRRSFQTFLYNDLLGVVSNGSGPSRLSIPSGNSATTFNAKPDSTFDDANGRFEWRPTDRDQVTIDTYIGHDDINNSRDLHLPTEVLDELTARGTPFPAGGGISIKDTGSVRNTGASGRWNRAWNKKIATQVTFGRSDHDSLAERSQNTGGRQGAFGELNVVDDTTLRLAVPVTFSATQQLTLGVQRTENRAVYQFESNVALPTTGTQLDAALKSQLDRSTTATTTAGFVEDHMVLGAKLIVDPGVRVSKYTQTGETYVEPRVAATWMMSSRLRAKGAWGQYHQFVNRVMREDAFQGDREFWAISDGSTIPVASSTNASAGAAYQTSRLLIDAEVFTRDIKDLSQLAPRLVGSTDPVDLNSYFQTGTGTAKGVELLGQGRLGRNNAWASYTWSRATYDFPGLSGEYPADYDRTHELKLVDTYTFGKWTASGTWVYSTGRPYTAPTGVETSTVHEPDGTATFERIVFGQKNAALLPAYHRLDLAVNRIFEMASNRTTTLGVTVFNAYNHDNVWYREFANVDGLIVENNVWLMPFTTNAFISIKF